MTLWGDGPDVAGALEVEAGTGVEVPDAGFESGERSELISILNTFW